ncbi:uncharacterized protein LOC142978028 [Anticarsia gemmatalis]|uniref:uncharacterized protein LOC142978028 n=1 Tax=Anticarsia gemmatalis TaxID=129554 RepID=UPI003F769FA6
MKYFIAFALLIAGISASVVPQTEETSVSSERIVTGQIIAAINDLSQSIADAGLDPLNIKREAVSYALPVPVIFNAAAFVEEILCFGLSDIRINRMSYNALTFRLYFDLELPRIHLSAGTAFGQATLFDNKFEAEVSGGFDINRIRVIGTVHVRVLPISGISIRSISINFTVGSVYSYLKVSLLGQDISDPINTLLADTIPDTLKAFKSDIDKLLELVLFDIIDANL